MIKYILLLLVCMSGLGANACENRHQIDINNHQPVLYYQQIYTYQFVPAYYQLVYQPQPVVYASTIVMQPVRPYWSNIVSEPKPMVVPSVWIPYKY